MNKIIFSEGGQPLFLNDIKLLQDNSLSVFTSLLLGIVGRGNNVFLLHPYTFDTEIIDEDEGIVRLTVHGNSIVINGEIIEFPSASFLNTEVAEKGIVCVCIRRIQEDMRTFEDGQDKCCIEKATAYLSCETQGISEFYDITELSSLIELLSTRLGIPTVAVWANVPVTFYNGYSGTVSYKISDGLVQLKIEISSSQQTWDADNVGVLFKISDYTLIDILANIRSEGLAAVPVDGEGNIMGYGSVVSVTPEGYCKIINRSNGGTLVLGYIQPCPPNATTGIINITLSK